MSDDRIDPQVFHQASGPSSPDHAEIPESEGELSTDELPDTSTDLAAEALHAARAIAAGQASAQPSRRLRRYRRRSGAGAGYTGAGPDARDPAPIGAILNRSAQDLGWVGPLAEARLFSRWPDIVGREIADRCQPTSLVDGELKIVSESTAWATQLRLMSRELLARIARETPPGMVRRVHISGPSGPSFKRGPWTMKGGYGVRDTFG